MSLIKLCYRNILENSTVTVTTENASFPKYRLYDRDIGKLFKGTAFASPFAIILDQGAVISYAVDRLLIPAGHNLNGLACSLRYSTDNFASDDHEAVGWTQGDALLIDKAFTVQTKRYWKLNVTAPATIVELPEMFLGQNYTFQRNPSYESSQGERKNIQRDETQSGRIRRVKFGNSRHFLDYDVLVLTAQKTDFESWDTVTDGTKSFWLNDEAGNVFYMELLNDLEFKYVANGIWKTKLKMLEAL